MKAFDEIKHNVLQRKLISLGVSRKLYLLLADYISNRTQSVEINVSISSKRIITSSAPQGSILGPLFLSCTIMTCQTTCFSHVHFFSRTSLNLFVNHMTMLLLMTSYVKERLKQLIYLDIWSEVNFLYSNAKKCAFIEYKANRRNKFNITNTTFLFKTEPIRPASSARNLGLIRNEHLNWTEHIATRVNKALKVLILLRRNTSNLLSSESKINLYNSNVNPTLLYATERWSANMSNAHLIENFVNYTCKALRWVSPGLSNRDSLLKNNLLPTLYF